MLLSIVAVVIVGVILLITVIITIIAIRFIAHAATNANDETGIINNTDTNNSNTATATKTRETRIITVMDLRSRAMTQRLQAVSKRLSSLEHQKVPPHFIMIQNLPTAVWPRYPVTRAQKNINTRRHSYGLGSDYDEAEGARRGFTKNRPTSVATRLEPAGVMSLSGLLLFALCALGFLFVRRLRWGERSVSLFFAGSFRVFKICGRCTNS